MRYESIKGKESIEQEEVGNWAKCFRKGSYEKDQKRPQSVAANNGDIIQYALYLNTARCCLSCSFFNDNIT